MVFGDGVKASGHVIARVGVAGGEESRSTEAQPVFIQREFHRRQLRIEHHAASGNGIEIVVSQHLIKRVADVDAAKVPVAGDADVVRVNIVRRHRADGSGPHQETVLVVVERSVVFVVVVADFGGVSLGEKILNVKVGDHSLLVAVQEAVQSTVGVFFQEPEISRVVLQAIVIQIAKDAKAGLLLGEDEPAKVTGELLNAGAHRNEIVVRAEVGELLLHKRFLQADVGVGARNAFTHVNVDDPLLLHPELIDVEGGSEPDAPIHRLEAGVAVEEIERQADGFLHESLPALAEESLIERILSRNAAGNIQPANVERGVADAGEIKKSVLAEDGIVALELVAIERIPPVAAGIGIFARPPGVANPGRERNVPAIRLRNGDARFRRHLHLRELFLVHVFGRTAHDLAIAGHLTLFSVPRLNRNFARLGGSGRAGGFQPHFDGEHLSGPQRHAGLHQRLVTGELKSDLIFAGNQIALAKDTVGTGFGAGDFAGGHGL